MKCLMNIGVVGCGYVGLSTAVAMAKKNKIHIFDIDKNRLNKLKEDNIPFVEADLEKDYFKYKTNIFIEEKQDLFIKKCNIFILAISTNLDSKTGSLDTSGIETWIKEISICKDKESFLIAIRSTIPIGFTEKMILKYKSNRIVYWPEFLREDNAYYDVNNPSRIVIGGMIKDASILIELITEKEHNTFPIHYVNSKEAETIKLFSNSYLAMRVAFFNELDCYAEKNNMNVRQIIDGICDDYRIGHFYNNPSFGYGGYCLPKDLQQLITTLGSDGILINAIFSSNEKRKRDITKHIADMGKRIGVYRLQMKKNSDNIRGSAITDIINELIKIGICVNIYEPILDVGLEMFPGAFFYNTLADMADDSDIIISNRMYDELLPYYRKVYTRDIYFRD